MKKNSNASELAARIAAAARQPAGMTSVPTPPQATQEPSPKPTPTKAVETTAKTSTVVKKAKQKPQAQQTIPITLRPDANLWNKFVLKASERTKEEGRVVSAQQIMLEALERSDA
jgi:hypothetical protein